MEGPPSTEPPTSAAKTPSTRAHLSDPPAQASPPVLLIPADNTPVAAPPLRPHLSSHTADSGFGMSPLKQPRSASLSRQDSIASSLVSSQIPPMRANAADASRAATAPIAAAVMGEKGPDVPFVRNGDNGKSHWMNDNDYSRPLSRSLTPQSLLYSSGATSFALDASYCQHYNNEYNDHESSTGELTVMQPTHTNIGLVEHIGDSNSRGAPSLSPFPCFSPFPSTLGSPASLAETPAAATRPGVDAVTSMGGGGGGRRGWPHHSGNPSRQATLLGAPAASFSAISPHLQQQQQPTQDGRDVSHSSHNGGPAFFSPAVSAPSALSSGVSSPLELSASLASHPRSPVTALSSTSSFARARPASPSSMQSAAHMLARARAREQAGAKGVENDSRHHHHHRQQQPQGHRRRQHSCSRPRRGSVLGRSSGSVCDTDSEGGAFEQERAWMNALAATAERRPPPPQSTHSHPSPFYQSRAFDETEEEVEREEPEPECNPSPSMLGRYPARARTLLRSCYSHGHSYNTSSRSQRSSASATPSIAVVDPHGGYRYLLDTDGSGAINLDRNASMERMEEENSRSRHRTESSVAATTTRSAKHNGSEGDGSDDRRSVVDVGEAQAGRVTEGDSGIHSLFRWVRPQASQPSQPQQQHPGECDEGRRRWCPASTPNPTDSRQSNEAHFLSLAVPLATVEQWAVASTLGSSASSTPTAWLQPSMSSRDERLRPYSLSPPQQRPQLPPSAADASSPPRNTATTNTVIDPTAPLTASLGMAEALPSASRLAYQRRCRAASPSLARPDSGSSSRSRSNSNRSESNRNYVRPLDDAGDVGADNHDGWSRVDGSASAEDTYSNDSYNGSSSRMEVARRWASVHSSRSWSSAQRLRVRAKKEHAHVPSTLSSSSSTLAQGLGMAIHVSPVRGRLPTPSRHTYTRLRDPHHSGCSNSLSSRSVSCGKHQGARRHRRGSKVFEPLIGPAAAAMAMKGARRNGYRTPQHPLDLLEGRSDTTFIDSRFDTSVAVTGTAVAGTTHGTNDGNRVAEGGADSFAHGSSAREREGEHSCSRSSTSSSSVSVYQHTEDEPEVDTWALAKEEILMADLADGEALAQRAARLAAEDAGGVACARAAMGIDVREGVARSRPLSYPSLADASASASQQQQQQRQQPATSSRTAHLPHANAGGGGGSAFAAGTAVAQEHQESPPLRDVSPPMRERSMAPAELRAEEARRRARAAEREGGLYGAIER